jgi:hypothetical protein
MKKILTALKGTRVFGALSDAFVSAAIANAKIVEVSAGALIMKVLLSGQYLAPHLCSDLHLHARVASHAVEHHRLAKLICPWIPSIRL